MFSGKRHKKQGKLTGASTRIGAVVAALAAAWFAYSQSGPAGSTGAPDTLVCTISSIHDGDSLRASCPGQKNSVKVRLHQIDAPELDQKHGIASRDALRNLCRRGEPVELVVTGTDQYDRILADARCAGKDVATTMVAEGNAWVYAQYVRDKTLLSVQERAQTARAGLWNDNAPTAPWEHRREQRRQ